MKKFGFRHLMYGWLAVVALALTSCDSENVTPINDKTLPEAIAKDFHERCEDYTIKRVYTAPEPYFDSGAMETYVTSEDNAGNECVVVYVDNAWNRTVRTLSDIDQLPSSVRYRLLTINQEARNDEFWEIKESDTGQHKRDILYSLLSAGHPQAQESRPHTCHRQ